MKTEVIPTIGVNIWYSILLLYNLHYITANSLDVSNNILNIDGCNSRISIQSEGSLILQNKSCDIYNIEIRLKNERSIIQLIPSVAKQNTTRYQNESTEIDDKNQIRITFYEFSTLENGNDASQIPIKISNWTLRTLNDINNNKYLSRTSFLRTEVVVEDDWTEFDLGFVYKEFKFESNEFTYREPKGIIMQNSLYRPNTVFLHQLFKPKDMNKSSIDITVSYINIDDGIGEYLLIGAGSEPFEGQPPLFLFSKSAPKKYHVNSDDAYVVFVSRSTRNQTGGFRISWQYTGTKIIHDKDDLDNITPEDVLESIPVCIYNITAASEEFRKANKDKMFEDFRMILADIANKYADHQNLPAKNFNLKPSSVELFRVAGYIASYDFPDDPNYSALYMMLKIKGLEKGKAAFTWKHLEKIFEIYLEQKSNISNASSYKVKKCPPDGNYTLWWRIGIYSTIPIFCCFFVAVWAWKNNHFAKYCSYEQKTESQNDLFDSETVFYTDHEKQDQVSQSVHSLIEENEYVRGPRSQTVPPVPLNLGKAWSNVGVIESSEENSDTEIFNKLSIQSASSKRMSQQPSLKNSLQPKTSLYNDEESNRRVSIMDLRETLRSENEVEHLYDSVASSINIKSKKMKETYL